MPFGEKLDAEGRLIDFDKIYQFIIKQAVESLDLHCVRCDEIEGAGWIHAEMFEQILEADVSVVDITSLNANVFYELGIRHALTSSVTVLIRKQGTHAPFNIQGLRVIDYDPLDLASVDKAKRQIASFIQNGLRHRLVDSPVHQVLENCVRIETRPEPILTTDYYLYRTGPNSSKHICLVTGDIRDVRCANVWVNSENTNMQMDRYYDRSISSIIRYLGASKDEAGSVVDDTIADELLQKMGDQKSVPSGYVLATTAGELAKTHNVKKLFHTASVVGEIGQGYRTIPDINRCVTNALKQMDEPQHSELQTILFPLIGTGKGQAGLQTSASRLLGAAIAYLDTHPNSTVDTVYFLTYTQEELAVCQNILANNHNLELAAVKS